MYSKFRWVCISFLFVYTYSIGHAASSNNSTSELQVVIDVSGSMKQNDPKNIRIPALKLLINLLPDGSKVGIWLFSEKTEVLVKTAIVDGKWKEKALSKINKVHSSGLYTNIEDAVRKSSKIWFQNSDNQPRHLILLTDGVVDISTDIMESAESRERILIEQISQLQQAGVKVHTIALSDNADTKLLDKLAFDTNGWTETVKHADQLQKVFFKMFKQAVPKDTVPIEGNEFTVDSSIDEFSVLLFKKAGARATQLISPDNTKIRSHNKSNNISWLSDKNYDLVTIKKPATGKWKIAAEMDPDNQVMIVTDLKFQVGEIPNHISDQEKIELTAYFSDKHQLISRDDFLELIEITIEHTSESGEINKWNMQAVIDKPGLFRKIMEPNLKKGKHTLKIKADGKTFQREYIHTLDVNESLIKVEMNVNSKARTITVKLTPDKNVINTKMLSIQANITQSEQQTETRELLNNNGTWELLLEEIVKGNRKIINFLITANSIKGNSISPSVKPIVIDDSLFAKPKLESKDNTPQENKPDIEDITLDKLVNDDDEESNEENDAINWIKTSAIVITVNIILIVIGFFLIKFFKKRAANSQAQLLARLE